MLSNTHRVFSDLCKGLEYDFFFPLMELQIQSFAHRKNLKDQFNLLSRGVLLANASWTVRARRNLLSYNTLLCVQNEE